MSKPTTGRPPAVALIDPKYPHNVGAALRACSCWGIGQRLPREERMKGYRSVAWARDDYVFDRFEPGSVTPVAVELRPHAESLVTFEHPDDALYVFGPEDG